MTDKKQILVSGPINTVRLEGKIGDINKVLYVMFDFHVNIQTQTQCEDIRAKNITSYLVENFDRVTNSDKIYDFFMEIYPETVTMTASTNITLKYGWAIQELFKKSFTYDPTKSKVVMSKTFPNIRFHYIDIRAYILSEVDSTFNSIHNYVDKLYHNKYISKNDVDSLVDGISIVISQLKVIYDLLFGKNTFEKVKKEHLSLIPETYKALEKYTPEKIKEINKVIINKILENHKYDKVKKVFNNYVNTTTKEQFNLMFNSLEDFYKYLQEIKNTLNNYGELAQVVPTVDYATKSYNYWQEDSYYVKIVSTIVEKVIIISDIKQDIMVSLVDLYFLRRFLNKDYITNGLSYTGALHSQFYIYMLVKYFDFKVTDASYCSEDISKINSLIKKESSSYIMSKFFYPPKFNQCSDLTGFPPLFE